MQVVSSIIFQKLSCAYLSSKLSNSYYSVIGLSASLVNWDWLYCILLHCIDNHLSLQGSSGIYLLALITTLHYSLSKANILLRFQQPILCCYWMHCKQAQLYINFVIVAQQACVSRHSDVDSTLWPYCRAFLPEKCIFL